MDRFVKHASMSPQVASGIRDTPRGPARPRHSKLRALKEREARPENTPGIFYVDHTCM